MPEDLPPGVYVEEAAGGPRPIEGVSTSTAGVVGRAERGPTRPRLVTSWGDYTRWYGGTIDQARSFLPLAVRGFFENGGRRLFVARVVGAGAAPANDQIAGGGNDLMVVTASGSGAWGDNLMLRVKAASQADPVAQPARDWFRITVLYYRDGIPAPFVDPTDPAQAAHPARREPDVLEDFDNLTAEAGRSNFVDTVVNGSSRLIQVTWDDGGGSPGTPDRPRDRSFSALANAGQDGNESVGDYLGNPALAEDRRTGFAGLEVIDEISMLCSPDEVNPSITDADQITTALVDQCERLRDRFALLNIAAGQGGQVSNIQVPRDTSYAAVYFPWIRVFDARIQQDVLVPPAGHVAGIYARSDIERGVHKAPANEVLRGLYLGDPTGSRQPLEYRITQREQDILNPRGVNVIRDFRKGGRGIRVWGARTMSSDPLWRYVNVRRLFLFLEESIHEGTRWVVFESNEEGTWAGVRHAVANFLTSVWRSGALQGLTQDKAFFVKCDRSTMTQADIDNGRLICLIGVAPVKPAEFVIFRIQQKTVEAE